MSLRTEDRGNLSGHRRTGQAAIPTATLAQYAFVLEQLPHPVVVTDTQPHRRLELPRRETFRFTKEEICGRSPTLLYAPDGIPRWPTPFSSGRWKPADGPGASIWSARTAGAATSSRSWRRYRGPPENSSGLSGAASSSSTATATIAGRDAAAISQRHKPAKAAQYIELSPAR